MDVEEALEKLMSMARADERLRTRLLATKGSDHSLSDFCAIATEAGCPMNVMKDQTHSNSKSQIADIEGVQLKLTTRLMDVYGAEEGLKSSAVLVPAILKDFSAMVEKAAEGETVSETYRTEDGVAEITLQAIKGSEVTGLTMDVRRR